jgi:CheY-like chemotaxis protein
VKRVCRERAAEGDAMEATAVQEKQQKPTVLIVEDDPDTQVYMKAVLNRHYEVLLASTGDEVKSQLAAHPEEVTIVLMDLSLKGGEDGLMLTRYLRQTDQWRDVPIIATTAHAFPEDRSKALSAGCNAYLSKPFGHKQLLALMEQLVS